MLLASSGLPRLSIVPALEPTWETLFLYLYRGVQKIVRIFSQDKYPEAQLQQMYYFVLASNICNQLLVSISS